MTMYLYRKAMHAVTLGTAIVLLSFSLQAQFRIPQPERKTPRAIGVLETFKNGSRRLIPVTFFYEKHYYDATFYHATPVPFTLYSETVYEVQEYGKPLGTFTVQSATQSVNSAAWFGNGRFKALPDPALLAKKKKLAPVVMEDPSKPVLHRRAGSEGDNPSAHPAQAAGSGASEGEDDPDRPKLHRREDSSSGGPTDVKSGSSPAAGNGQVASSSAPAQDQAPAGAQAAGNQTEESSGQDPDRPKLQRRDDSSSAGKSTGGGSTATPAKTTTASAPASTGSSPSTTPAAAKGGAAASGATTAAAELTPSDDPDHPILRRGKPVQVQSGQDLPDFKKEEPVSREVAVSDAGPSEAQPLIFACREEERKQMESSARELAEAELRRVAAHRGLGLPSQAKGLVPAKSTAPGKKTVTPAKATALAFADEQFIPYDLDYNNYATVVYSARYVPEGAQSSGANGASTNYRGKGWVVTVVARQDDGKLIKLYSAVSDPRELDLYPEVRLVDAVDPEGYGRASLLFREQKRDGVSWLLGRVTGYELQTQMETPER
jgi:hypothetical protein